MTTECRALTVIGNKGNDKDMARVELDHRVNITALIALTAWAITGAWWLSALNSRVDQHDVRIERVESRLETLVSSVSSLERDVSNINLHLGYTNDTLNRLERYVEQVNNNVERLLQSKEKVNGQ